MTLRAITTFIGSIPETIAQVISRRPYLSALAVFAFFFVIFAIIYLPNTILSAGDDHFFHFRFAYEMREQGFLNAFQNFKAIYFSKIAQGVYYPYYNFLFYLVIIPFTYLTPLYLGIKLYAVVAASLFFTVLYLAARFFNIRYAFLWVLFIFSIASTSSIYRLFLSRPYVLAPAFLVVLILCLERRRYVLAALVSFAYLYWYDATFFFPLCTAVVYYLFEQLYRGRAAWKGLLWVLGGTAAAVLVVMLMAPGFLAFLHDIIFGDVLTVTQQIRIPEGGELYPIDIFGYIHDNTLLFAFLIIACCYELWLYTFHKAASAVLDEHAPLRATLVFLAGGFFAADVLISGRFGDYLLMLFGLYLILALDSIRARVTVEKTLGAYLKAGLFLALGYLFITAMLSFNTSLANNGSPVQLLEGTGTWLADHTQPGDVIFDANWSWFAQLYYWSPADYYVAGIEPRFLYTYDSTLYWLWNNMSNYGIACDSEYCPDLYLQSVGAYGHPGTPATTAWIREEGNTIAGILVNKFHATYIVSSYQYTLFNMLLDNNPHFTKVYGGNRTFYVYSVTP